ncbi:MAG: rhamnulokinase [Candidatus Omnitrophica bacterium]|nr:rhamnulokinase [Candidatus Omnitrophota bacterium]
MTHHYLACDLGADSGRLMLGSLDEQRLALEELHRFPNSPAKLNGSLCWDIPRLLEELKAGLKKAAKRGLSIASISCDSWGVDYLLYNSKWELIPPTYHYRDARCQRGVERVRSKVDWNTVFDETGIQFMPLNTIYQLAAETPDRLGRAQRLLCIGDGFNFYLSGAAKAEVSLASTTQLYNPRTKTWSKRLIDALDLPIGLFPDIAPSGTRLGALKPELARETGLPAIQVVATCSHDTGAAVAAVPASGTDWAYLSSGTWSLIGVELAEPIITPACRDLNFTNEIGYGSSVRLLKNIIGLWLVQECRRHWAKESKPYDFASLERLAAAAPPFVSLINPADARFLAPDDMPAKIASYCREHQQPVPTDVGATVRCIYESLALLYRRTLLNVEKLIGRKIARLHIVGGGSKDSLLNQFSANALQIPVIAGPVEATAAGNVLIQAITLGHLPSLEAARQVVRHSMAGTTIQPEATAQWEQAYGRFEKLLVN